MIRASNNLVLRIVRLCEITEPISPEARSQFADIISNFAQDVPNSHIKFSTIGKIILIRLEEEIFLLRDIVRYYCISKMWASRLPVYDGICSPSLQVA